MDPAEQQIAPGEQIGPYVVSRRLGAGGMGEVYLARHRHLDRDAAVKVLLPEISMNQTVVSRFFTEARATAQLRHPNIVEIFDCDVLPDGRAYIVMEYLRGESLRQTMDRVGRMAPTWSSIAAITGMVADALHAAHDSGIVHRDLKPDNTYLTAQRSQRVELTVKVLDFGIAKLLSGSSTTGGSTTRTGALIGTPLYMSPEQCRGIPSIDHRADIYSLGCVLFEMVVGQPPFVAEAPGDILMAHMVQPPPPMATFDASVPEQLDALATRMLSKDPNDRPQSMAEVVGACEAFLGVPRGEFTTALRPPPGFPEQVVQAATQILPATGLPPLHTTPSNPPLSSRQTPSPRQPTPIGRPESTTVEPAQTPRRPQRTPSRSPSRRGSTGDDAPQLTPAQSELAVQRPKWLLPAAILVPLIVLGIVGAYFLSRPKPQPPVIVEPQRPTQPEPFREPEAETLAKPGAFVPPPSAPAAPATPPEPIVVVHPEEKPEAKRPRSERRQTNERKSSRRSRGTSDKRAEPSAPTIEFKAVGD